MSVILLVVALASTDRCLAVLSQMPKKSIKGGDLSRSLAGFLVFSLSPDDDAHSHHTGTSAVGGVSFLPPDKRQQRTFFHASCWKKNKQITGNTLPRGSF